MPHDAQHCKSCRVAAPETWRTRCAACAAARRAKEAEQRESRRETGKCVTCARRAVKGRRYCRAHLDYYAARTREAAGKTAAWTKNVAR